ncbi:MAG: ABC transporter permease subunit [Gammaproteobacteria bacterium]|nr:ABC transporter permease subunit [Gammaproteobacteria bacterium]
MFSLIIRRVLYGFLALVCTAFLIFIFTDLMPGDFATQVLGRSYTIATAEVIREKLGLYLPLVSRFVLWLGDALRGDFGHSWSGYEITPIIQLRMQRSLWLALVTAIVAFPVAVALGLFSALNRHRPGDRVLTIAGITMLSVPEYLVGYAAVAVLAVKFDFFPSLSLFEDDAPLSGKLHAVTLPVITLCFVAIPPVMRIVRASLVNTLNSEYIEMAVLKGVSPLRILVFHALPNNIGPVINAITLGFAHLIAGIVIVEIVFVYPGIGSLFVDSLTTRDVPVILACGVILASCYILLVMVADVVAIASNPRLVARQRMSILHPGQVVKGLRYAPIVLLAGLSLYLISLIPETPSGTQREMVVDGAPPVQGALRARLTREELFASDNAPAGPVHNAHFMPLGNEFPAHEPFAGRITVRATKILGYRAGGRPRYGFGEIPDLEIGWVSHGKTLIPVDPGFLESGDSDWTVLVGPGRVWSEQGDGRYSRASFPFTLVGREGADAHQGLGMFLYGDGKVSNLRFQIVQESSLRQKFTAWGQAPLEFSPGISRSPADVVEEYLGFARTNLPRRPWTQLYDAQDESLFGYFDGTYNQGNVSSSGMIVDGIVHQRDCQTRLGNYPYCEAMRHSVYSVTKSLGAAVTLARLAQKYGDRVLDEKILDYVDIRAAHDGWDNVTFRDALNMATGIGDVVPQRVNYYVDPDETEEASRRVFNEPTSLGKIREISRYKRYPWGPGKVLRYRTSDTFVLGFAMDRYLKSREGEEAMLWEMMNEEVFQPIGIRHLPVVHTRDREKRNRIPKLGYAMVPTTDSIGKIVRLLRSRGQHHGTQLLSRGVVQAMMVVNRHSGLASGWKYREGGEARYHMSMWLVPYEGLDGCSTTITAMVGAGGNYVIPMTNGITAFRFADRYGDHPGTYDSYEMRKISDFKKSICDNP